MSRLPDSSHDVGAYPSEESRKKVVADMEITNQQVDLIASGLLRFVWQHSQN